MNKIKEGSMVAGRFGFKEPIINKEANNGYSQGGDDDAREPKEKCGDDSDKDNYAEGR